MANLVRENRSIMEYFNDAAFSSRIEDLMGKHHIPALSVAVLKDDQVSSAGYGNASFKPLVPCTADTLFDVASCAKSLTAASIALLVEDEAYPEIQYDAIMSSLIPEDFVMSGSGFTEGVTVEDLLSHRTGMAPHDSSYFGPHAENPDDAQSITRNLRNLAVAAPLRSRYLYCNLMYTVLTHLIQVKCKQSFSEFLLDRIFIPLEMTSTNLQPANARAKGLGDRMATGYIHDNSNGYRECPSADCPEGQGAGSLITSANDFIKFVKGLVNREGPISNKIYQGLVKLRSFPSHHPARLKPFTSPPFYAAGMDVYYYRGHMVVGHNGVIPGFGSRFAFIPDIRFGVVVMGNSEESGPVASILIRELIDEALGVPEAERSGAMRGNNKTAESSKKSQKKETRKKKPKDNGSSQKQKLDEGKNGKQQDHDPKNPQIKPLGDYTGRYWNPGYRGMKVEVKDNHLFVDASDRAMGFTLIFNHIFDQRKYIAHLIDTVEGGIDPIEAEFVFKDNQVVRMGLRLEQSLKELIWFQRVDEAASTNLSYCL